MGCEEAGFEGNSVLGWLQLTLKISSNLSEEISQEIAQRNSVL